MSINREAMERMRNVAAAIPHPDNGVGVPEWYRLARVGVLALVAMAENLAQLQADIEWIRMNGTGGWR